MFELVELNGDTCNGVSDVDMFSWPIHEPKRSDGNTLTLPTGYQLAAPKIGEIVV